MDPERTRQARRLFAGIAPEYDRMGSVLSFGQEPRWRRFLVSKVNAIPGSWVLDVATGTGLVARELARKNVRVVGLDQSPDMVSRGLDAVRERGLDGRVRFALGQAQALPFGDGAFDAVTFTYLLRYVDDPAATVAELVRVLRPGGVMAARAPRRRAGGARVAAVQAVRRAASRAVAPAAASDLRESGRACAAGRAA